jgi:hypothetical protein
MSQRGCGEYVWGCARQIREVLFAVLPDIIPSVNPRTFLRLSQHRWFWRLRARAQRVRFGFLGRVFQVRYFAKQERGNQWILFSFLRVTFLQLFVAIALASALQVLDLLFVPLLASWWPAPDPANYVSWLGAIAQIGGVFIALYFTAVTAAAGAVYAQVPNNIRDLLARERIGNIYIRYLTQATFLPLCLVALHFLGLEPMRVAVPFLVLLAGTGIIAFAALGRRAFDLFDPTRLAASLFGDLGGWLEQVSVGGFNWEDRSFQAHAHRQAASVVDTLQTLSDLAAAHANLDSAPLVEFSVKVLILLAEYEQRKLRIPTDSLWFEQKYEHKNWYQTEDSTVQLAHHTGTSLGPTSVPEYNWLESRLHAIPIRCFELNVGRRRLHNLQGLLSGFDAYMAALATNGNVQAGFELSRKMRDIFEDAGSASVPAAEKQPERAEDVGMADAICFLPLRILVAYRAALGRRTPQATKERIERLRWDDVESIYNGGFVAEELRQLEWLLPRIKLESEVEGTILTPVWYQQDLVSKSQAENLSKDIDAVVNAGTRFFLDWSDRLVRQGRPWQSAAVLSRHLEYLNKLEHHLSFFKAGSDALVAARHLTDRPWPDLKPELWIAATQKSRERLIRAVARHIVLLAASQKPEGVPDYLGQFVHETGENLFDALLGRRAGEARALIRPYLAGTLVLFEGMKPSAPKPDVWTEQKLQIAAAPVLDILELSGYGKLFAELYADGQLWTAVSGVWDNLLGKRPGILQWLAAIITGGIPHFQLPHRGLMRTTWSMRVQQELTKLPHRNSGRGGVGGIFGADVVHSSPLVRCCARYDFHNGRDLFAALYLSKQAGADRLDWGRGAKDLIESLRLEEKSYGEDEENGQDEEE